MNYLRTLAALTVMSAMAAGAAGAETIVLKRGYRVTGDVLRSDAKTVIVDIGCAVLRLPRSEIVKMSADAGTATRPAGATTRPVERTGSAWQLYRTATLAPTSIEANSRRHGEAVVMVSTPGGLGSGFVISPDGHCITNYHVIAGETRVKITVFRRTATGYEQKHYKKVKIVALNPFVDLALLKIVADEETFKYVYLGRMDTIKAGQPVFAIGNPLGLTRTVSQGIVSTTNRNMRGQLYIQTTTDINPGNSGGPLFNLSGEVIGVTSMGYLYMGGLNFAIPADVVKRFIINRDAFAYDEDNPNNGFRYLQPDGRVNKAPPPPAKLPSTESDSPAKSSTDAKETS